MKRERFAKAQLKEARVNERDGACRLRAPTLQCIRVAVDRARTISFALLRSLTRRRSSPRRVVPDGRRRRDGLRDAKPTGDASTNARLVGERVQWKERSLVPKVRPDASQNAREGDSKSRRSKEAALSQVELHVATRQRVRGEER